MDHQEWFERFSIRLGFNEDHFCEQVWVKEERGLIQTALLKMAINSLLPLDRKVIELLFFDGYSEREAAQKLKINKSKLHRIKNQALEMLAKSVFIKLAGLPHILRQRNPLV